jgi:ribosomal subunit interface protein
MNVAVTARHCEVPEELQQRAREVLARLAALTDRAVDGTVVFDVASGRAVAEIRITAAKGGFIATADAQDHRSALDRAEEKVRRQLDRGSSAPRGRGAKGVA